MRRSKLVNNNSTEIWREDHWLTISSANNSLPFLADTALITNGVPECTAMNFKPNVGETQLLLNRVHNNAVNAWMPDGHAQSVSDGELDRLSLASYPF